MHRIVYLEGESIIADVRRPDFPHCWVEHATTLPPQVAERLAGATIAIVNKLPVDAGLIAALPDLQMVAVAATGTNNIDLDACRRRGIVVSNIRGYAVHTVPEHVFALLLALSRNVVAYRQAVAAGNWQRSEQFCCIDYPIRDLHGATLAVIGSGSLGGGVIRLGRGFRHARAAQRAQGRAERASRLHRFRAGLARGRRGLAALPADPRNEAPARRTRVAAMRPSALLINTARGGLVDEAALVRALQQGWIAGAGFDVLSVEPPSTGNVLLAPQLLALPNFLLTPHVAWASRPAMQALADQLTANLEAFARGEPQNRVA
jgi:glycerate dehydrogenase